MLILKSTPKHNFSIFIELNDQLDPEWMLGRFDKDGKLIENEIECELDGKQAIIKLYDYFKEDFERLPLLNFILRLGYGFDGKFCQKILLKKYPKITKDTKVGVVLYELIEMV